MTESFLRRKRAVRMRKSGDNARAAKAWAEAARSYRDYLLMRPDDFSIWVQLGHMMAEQSDFDSAADAYRIAFRLAPDNADLALCRGHLARRRGSLEEAREFYASSLALDDNAAARRAYEEVVAEQNIGRAADPTAPDEIMVMLDVLPEEPDAAYQTDHAADVLSQNPIPHIDDNVPLAGLPENTASLPDGEKIGLAPSVELDRAAGGIDVDEQGIADKGIVAMATEPSIGRLEGWIGRSISGFARRTDTPFPLVEFRSAGRVVGRVRASIGRDDPDEFGFHAILDIDGEHATVSAHRLPGNEELADSPVLLHPKPPAPAGPPLPASAARYAVAKTFIMSREADVALFVTHSATGRLKPHVAAHLSTLQAAGIETLLIVVVDRAVDLPTSILDLVRGAIVRENAGYDFAAWAHALALHPEIYAANLLILANDSIFGPRKGTQFTTVLEQIRASEADIIGLTESHEYSWHLQSYFLALKRTAIASWAFQAFMTSVRILGSKDEVVRTYEVRLTALLEQAGLHAETLFPSHRAMNPSLFGWRELLADGFPFAKLLLLRGVFPEANLEGWREVMAQADFDVPLLDKTLDAAGEWGPSDALGSLLARPVLPAPVTRPLRVAFFGPWNYDNGLGMASRNLIDALRLTNIELNLHPVKQPFHIHKPVAPAVDIVDFAGVPDIAIIHLNPDSWHLLTPDQMSVIHGAQRRIGYWVWEMAHLPPAWHPHFNSVDRIWAPSRYCAALFEREGDLPVDVIPHPVPLPPVVTDAARRNKLLAHIGVPSTARTILYVFDGSSYLVRKNPQALVRAFSASCLAQAGWVLILKTKHLMDRPADGHALQTCVGHADGVHLLDEVMEPGEMASLMASADIYASPHCSEGFGLTVAEAMSHGKPVVATDFSGTMDFLDAECGYPVRAHAWRLDEDFGHYTAGGEWARIDEPALSNALVRAATAIDAGDTGIGERARAQIAKRLSYKAIAESITLSLAATLSSGHGPSALSRSPASLVAGTAMTDVVSGSGVYFVALGPDGRPTSPFPDDMTEDVWLVFAPTDAIVAPSLSSVLLRHASARPDVSIFYADDIAAGDTARDRLNLKPDFDLTMLVSRGYIGFPLMMHGSVLKRLGTLDWTWGVAACDALILSAHFAGLSIARIPEVLLGYQGPRPRVASNVRRAMLETFARFAGSLIPSPASKQALALSRVFTPQNRPHVSLIVATQRSAPHNGVSYIETLLEAIAISDWPMDRLEVIVGDDVSGSAPWLERIWPFAMTRLETVRAPGERFNYAAKMNVLWQAAQHEQLIFLNDDVCPLNGDWIGALQSFALDETVGGVGARLAYEDGTLQHAGVAPLFSAVAHLWIGQADHLPTYQDWAVVQREWSMVTGAVFATRKSLMKRLSGFDERFSLEFNDIDLCLRLRMLGLRIVYNPMATFSHVEKASRGLTPPPGDEMARFVQRWRDWLDGDPSFHPGLRRDRLEPTPFDDVGAWYR